MDRRHQPGRLRAAVQGTSGSLYIAIDGANGTGAILEVRPAA